MRSFLGPFVRCCSLLVLLAGAEVAACSSDEPSTEIRPAARPQQIHDLHFALGANVPQGRLSLRINGKKYPLSAHTETSLAALRSKRPELFTRTAPTHYVEHASFSAVGLQTYDVVSEGDRGNAVAILTAMHVPTRGRRTQAAAPAAVGAATTYEVDPQDPAHLVSWDDAAAWLVFQDPALLTLDPASANTVLDHIKATPDFPILATSIMKYMASASTDPASPNRGWLVSVPTLDAQGIQRKFTMPGGGGTAPMSHWVLAGSPEFHAAGYGDLHEEAPNHHGTVRVATPYEKLPAAKASASRLVRNDAALQDQNWVVTADDSSRAFAGSVSATVPVDGGTDAGTPAYTFTADRTVYLDDSKLVVTAQTGNKVTFTMSNDSFRRQGIFVRFRDNEGNLMKRSSFPANTLPDPAGVTWFNSVDSHQYGTFLGILTGRNVILGIPIQKASTSSYDVTLPPGASSFEVNVAAAGFQHSVLPSYLPSEPEKYMQAPAWVQTVLLDVLMPVIAMSCGAAAAEVRASPLAKLLAEAGVQAGVRFAGEMIATGSGATALSPNIAWEFLNDIAGDAPDIAKAIAEFIAIQITEKTAEELAEGPFAWVGVAATIASDVISGVELSEVVVSASLYAPFIYNKIAASEEVDLVVTPQVVGGRTQYFPPGSVALQADVYLDEQKVPTQVLVPIDMKQNAGNGPASLTIKFPQQPTSKTFTAVVTALADTGTATAVGQVESVPNIPVNGVTTTPISMVRSARPLTGPYQRNRVLTWDPATSKHVFVSATDPSAPAPTLGPYACGDPDPAKPSVCGAGSITVTAAGALGYSWLGTGAAFTKCFATDANERLNGAQSVNLSAAGDVDVFLKRTPCATDAPVYLTYRPEAVLNGGRHAFITPLSVNGINAMYAVPIDLANTTAIAGDTSAVLGRFISSTLDDVAVSASGHEIVALSKASAMVEVLSVSGPPSAAADAPVATPIGGPGTQIGTLSNPVGVAAIPGHAAFVVLEAGASPAAPRVQAFTFAGKSAERFKGKATFDLLPQPEDAGKLVTYTGIKAVSGGFVFVSSYVGAEPATDDFHLDIYRSDGSFLLRSRGFVAAKFDVNIWHDAYTLDFSQIRGRTDTSEPSITEWIVNGN